MDHILGVAHLTEEFTEKFFSPNVGKILGMLHDLGKFSSKFQSRVRGKEIRVDHSTAGAVLCSELEKYFSNKSRENLIYKILKYPIMAHHSGLMDFGTKHDTDTTLMGRLKANLTDFSDWKDYIDVDELKDISIGDEYEKFLSNSFSTQMLIRFLASSVVDGDRLDA